MLYQVLARTESESAWEPYQAMTRDPLQALNLVRKASQTFAEVSVIQAATAPLLREQIRHLSTQQGATPSASPVPSLTATPRIRFTPTGVESQRWEMERGPGGDHDVPYRFSGPISSETLHRWARLMLASPSERSASLRDASAVTETDSVEVEREVPETVRETLPIRFERLG